MEECRIDVADNDRHPDCLGNRFLYPDPAAAGSIHPHGCGRLAGSGHTNFVDRRDCQPALGPGLLALGFRPRHRPAILLPSNLLAHPPGERLGTDLPVQCLDANLSGVESP